MAMQMRRIISDVHPTLITAVAYNAHKRELYTSTTDWHIKVRLRLMAVAAPAARAGALPVLPMLLLPALPLLLALLRRSLCCL